MSKKSPFYSVDLIIRVGDLVIGADIFTNGNKIPDIWRVISINQPAENISPSTQRLTVKRKSDNKVHSGIKGNEVMKYETYMIFRIMAMMKRVTNQSLGLDVELP